MESESSYNADELGQYRSLSTSAVIALVLGLLSSMAFFSPLLLVVPLSAVAVASWALAKIKSSEGGLLGARLAYCGLALAIVFGLASVARIQVRVRLLGHQATAAAELWMSMLARGKAQEAIDLMTSSARSELSPTDDGEATVPIFETALPNIQILQDPLAEALTKRLESGKEPFAQHGAIVAHELKQPRAVLAYGDTDTQAEAFSFSLILVKIRGVDSDSIWLVDSWKIDTAAH